mmetsp:Transcript_136233/g.236884  ORF Transcript_136233/g.236884 Transcript_136233/m.236884 type:complete len:308 (-) Transcript_136233:96-1019(-)
MFFLGVAMKAVVVLLLVAVFGERAAKRHALVANSGDLSTIDEAAWANATTAKCAASGEEEPQGWQPTFLVRVITSKVGGSVQDCDSAMMVYPEGSYRPAHCKPEKGGSSCHCCECNPHAIPIPNANVCPIPICSQVHRSEFVKYKEFVAAVSGGRSVQIPALSFLYHSAEGKVGAGADNDDDAKKRIRAAFLDHFVFLMLAIGDSEFASIFTTLDLDQLQKKTWGSSDDALDAVSGKLKDFMSKTLTLAGEKDWVDLNAGEPEWGQWQTYNDATVLMGYQKLLRIFNSAKEGALGSECLKMADHAML